MRRVDALSERLGRREFLTVAALGVFTECRRCPAVAEEPSGNTARNDLGSWHRAIAYLWSQQAPDGGWHSRTYAVMRSGQALTPYVLHALMTVPEDRYPRPPEGVARGLDFIRTHGREHGALGLDDGDLPEYPCHSTAAAIHCLLAARDEADRRLILRLRDFLIDAQYAEHHGIREDHLAYGAWGFAPPRRQGMVDHLDISHTRHVLQAIRAVDEHFPDDSIPARVYARAERFLRLLQRHPDEDRPHPQPIDWPDDAPTWNGRAPSFDGGFYFSPVVLTANKGGWQREPSHWKSYATATCDGLLGLLAAGVPRQDMRVKSASHWLRNHPGLDAPDGVPTEQGNPWGHSIKFYHAAVRGECYDAIGWPETARMSLTTLLASQQLADGSFINRQGLLMKEDDPLLCTTLAVKAFTRGVSPHFSP